MERSEYVLYFSLLSLSCINFGDVRPAYTISFMSALRVGGLEGFWKTLDIQFSLICRDLPCLSYNYVVSCYLCRHGARPRGDRRRPMYTLPCFAKCA